MQRVVSEVCLSCLITLFVSISWAGMLMIKKMGIRGINLEETYQATEFSTLSSTDRYELHMVIEPVKSVIGKFQMRGSYVHGSKTRIKCRVIPRQTGFSE